MSQIIAREDEEVTEDYEKIKALLLKRYQLTPKGDCPERYQVSTPNKKELNRDNDVPTAEIQSYRLKPQKSLHLSSNIPINALQYVTAVVGEKEVKTLIDSGAQIPIINEKFLSQGKITAIKTILTSAFGERIEAGLPKFLVSLKSEHKDKFIAPLRY
ncbi:hypothetical protein AVEN_32217-1 [Araneus ventricosus]|uniref:Uncharacterized protein n=1 Tax=Araneus ventricosus TaxID=182803 RepID=A0A4Y2VKS4_ARAVE|nr:hypothetical protein AVEN_32217-1 [Araneus ventricosus]